MKTTGNTMLITGGGSGIGRELARRFQALGNTVIVAGRRREALEETIGGRKDMHALTLDVGDPGSVAGFTSKVVAEHPRLNVLVNNAGVMVAENLTRKRDLTAAQKTIATNLLGPIRLIDALVDQLCAQPDSAIVNVSSGLAFVPFGPTPTYNATKAALHSYTVTLRTQLEGKVEVIELAPPGVRTELMPGQSKNEACMPLDTFVDETMELFQREHTPKEILVEAVAFLRWAERDGHFDQAVSLLSARQTSGGVSHDAQGNSAPPPRHRRPPGGADTRRQKTVPGGNVPRRGIPPLKPT